MAVCDSLIEAKIRSPERPRSIMPRIASPIRLRGRFQQHKQLHEIVAEEVRGHNAITYDGTAALPNPAAAYRDGRIDLFAPMIICRDPWVRSCDRASQPVSPELRPLACKMPNTHVFTESYIP